MGKKGYYESNSEELKKMEKELLELVKIPSRSKETLLMEEYIESKLIAMNIEYNKDEAGNIFYLEHNQPLLSAHIDTVGEDSDIYVLNDARINEGIIKGYGNLGGDDKCGIFITLKMLEKYGNKINFIFSVDEEIGRVGIKIVEQAQKENLKHCLYGIVLDRRGNSDIIGINNNYCVKEFELAVYKLLEPLNYSPNTGSLSDADILNKYMSVVNLSVGYYNPHRKDEYIVIKDVVKAMKGTDLILQYIDERYDCPKLWN